MRDDETAQRRSHCQQPGGRSTQTRSAETSAAAPAVSSRIREFLSESVTVKCLAAFLLIGFLCLLAVLVFARVVGVRPVVWFPDTLHVLTVFVSFVLLVGLVWDSLLVALGLALSAPKWISRSEDNSRRWWSLWRERGFYSLGLWPVIFVLLAVYFLLETSNITNISLKLLESNTVWRDAFFWNLEKPLLIWVANHPINVSFWENLYNSGWCAEMVVLCIVIIKSRSPVTTLHFLVSFILLFYIGRILGLVTPVMGPAFFQPESYSFLQGSATAWMMARVGAVMEAGPDAIEQGALLLGGVAAMPSLHVGMVSLAAYWLCISSHWAALVAVPWVLCVWTSTVLLGWHYVVDGLGGLFLAAACVAITRGLLKLMKFGGP